MTSATVCSIGFYGKLPARGDFVRSGLSRGFIDAWDEWIAGVLPASRDRLGERWLDAWLVAPVWRFALPAGQLGAEATLGLWMPSVDRVGRHFPLAIAMTLGDGAPPTLAYCGSGWLDAAEQAGIDALEYDLSPEDLAVRIGEASMPDAVTPDGSGDIASDLGIWWTDGGPNVPPTRRTLRSLPDGAMFAGMLATAEPD